MADRPKASDSVSVSHRGRPLMAVGQALAINLLVNRVDAWLLGAEWARVGPRDWSRNLRQGWEWDENAFGVNMFSHPYHGALYYNAARAQGLSYWESVPVAFLGSMTWEYFGETYRPSLNDFYMTSLGGIALGEVFHRIAASIRDNRQTGRNRTLRELAALPFDPMGGINRLIRGEWRRTGPNPIEHQSSDAYLFRIHGGVRITIQDGQSDSATGSGTLLADLNHGDLLLTPYRHPFEVFSVRGQLSSAGGLNLLAASGRLYGKRINDSSATNRHALAINQRYDFISNPSQRFGGQSFEGGVASRWKFPGDFRLRTHLFLSGIALGAIDAPDAGVGERTYDFGPGVGTRFELGLEKRGNRYVTVWGRTEYLHSISGASADHVAHYGGFELTLPVRRGLGVGLHTSFFDRESRYSDRPADNREFSEVRLFLALTKFDLRTVRASGAGQ
jgi:hypothetical protein